MSQRERDITTQATPYIDPPSAAERHRKYESHPLAWADWPEGQSSYVNANGNPTVKWRNTSINRLRERKEEVSDAHTALWAAQKYLQRAQRDYSIEVESLLGIKVDIGHSPCKESPTSTCLFPLLDGALSTDQETKCLFCQISPQERRELEER